MKLSRNKDWNYLDFNTKTKSYYDENGYDIRGYDRNGYNKKGFDIHGFDIKRIHKKTKTKFDEEGYDKERYDADGYAKDGFDRSGHDVDGYGRNGIHKVTGENYFKTIILELPPDIGTGYPYGKRRKHDTQEYFLIYTDAINRKFLTIEGILTELGYRLYLSLLHVAGKDTVHGAPKKKSGMFIPSGELVESEIVTHDKLEREYCLTSKGAIILEILARTFSNSAIPHI